MPLSQKITLKFLDNSYNGYGIKSINIYEEKKKPQRNQLIKNHIKSVNEFDTCAKMIFKRLLTKDMRE